MSIPPQMFYDLMLERMIKLMDHTRFMYNYKPDTEVNKMTTSKYSWRDYPQRWGSIRGDSSARATTYNSRDEATSGDEAAVELIPLEAVEWAADKTITDCDLCRSDGDRAKRHILDLLAKRAWATPEAVYACPGDRVRYLDRDVEISGFVSSVWGSGFPESDKKLHLPYYCLGPGSPRSPGDLTFDPIHVLEISKDNGKTWAPCKGYKP